MTITAIAMFKTSDEKLFYTEEDAMAHELHEVELISFTRFLEKNDVYNSYMESEDIAQIILSEYRIEKK